MGEETRGGKPFVLVFWRDGVSWSACILPPATLGARRRLGRHCRPHGLLAGPVPDAGRRPRPGHPASSARPAATTPAAAPAPSRAVRLAEEKAATDSSALRDAPAVEENPFDGGLRGISTRGALDVLTQNDPLDRTAAFLALLRRLDRTNAYELLDAFEQGEFGFDRGREYRVVPTPGDRSTAPPPPSISRRRAAMAGTACATCRA